MTSATIVKGRVLSFAQSPFTGTPTDAAQIDDALVIADGRIAQVGAFDDLRAAFPDADVDDQGARVILAGFVDAHVHYPQTAIIASWA